MSLVPEQYPTVNGKSRILIVDDHAVIVEGLAAIIEDEPDLQVVGGAETIEDAIQLIGQLKPDALIIDISLGQRSGLELIAHVREKWPAIPMLALSMHEESLYAERAMRAGARGYIMKNQAMKKVLVALRTILKGEIYVSEKMALRMAQKLVDRQNSKPASILEQLSDREFEVFNLISQGVGPTEIANRLDVSVKTIETHRERIKQKLNLKTGTALTRFALEWAITKR